MQLIRTQFHPFQKFLLQLALSIILKQLEMDVEEESKSSLESPLIHQRPLQDDKCIDKAGMIVELKRQMQLAGPLVVVSFLQYSFQMISVMFVGHLGDLSLSSASMATSFAGVTGFSYMVFNIAFTFPITLLNHILAYALYTCTTVLIVSQLFESCPVTLLFMILKIFNIFPDSYE